MAIASVLSQLKTGIPMLTRGRKAFLKTAARYSSGLASVCLSSHSELFVIPMIYRWQGVRLDVHLHASSMRLFLFTNRSFLKTLSTSTCICAQHWDSENAVRM